MHDSTNFGPKAGVVAQDFRLSCSRAAAFARQGEGGGPDPASSECPDFLHSHILFLFSTDLGVGHFRSKIWPQGLGIDPDNLSARLRLNCSLLDPCYSHVDRSARFCLPGVRDGSQDSGLHAFTARAKRSTVVVSPRPQVDGNRVPSARFAWCRCVFGGYLFIYGSRREPPSDTLGDMGGCLYSCAGPF